LIFNFAKTGRDEDHAFHHLLATFVKHLWHEGSWNNDDGKVDRPPDIPQ
jgi:hypothetical protein